MLFSYLDEEGLVTGMGCGFSGQVRSGRVREGLRSECSHSVGLDNSRQSYVNVRT